MCHKGGRSAVAPAKDSLSSPPLRTLATVRVLSRSQRSAWKYPVVGGDDSDSPIAGAALSQTDDGALFPDAGGLRQDRVRTRWQVPDLVLETTDIVHLTVVVVFVGD